MQPFITYARLHIYVHAENKILKYMYMQPLHEHVHVYVY